MARHKRIRNITRHYIHSFNFVGIAGGVVLFCFSLFPSLLPRPWLFQALISALAMAIGYGTGTVFSTILRWVIQHEVPVNVKRIAWRGLAVLGPLSVISIVVLHGTWQQEIQRLIATDKNYPSKLVTTVLVAFIVALLLIEAGRVVVWLAGVIQRRLDKLLPYRLSVILSLALTAYFIVWLVSGLGYSTFVKSMNRAYLSRNTATPPGVLPVSQVERSGSTASVIPWNSLGYQGKQFVASGPTITGLEQFSGRAAKEPIRVYSGLDSAPTPEERAALAVKDLRRAGGFDRKVLVLATPTGTGWLEPPAVDAIEYMYNGDTAIIAQQYSYLPSWVSFIVDKDNARQAGNALFDAVYEAWSALPPSSRPKLVAYGLSLGSFGNQAAYSSVNDIKRSVDGALFIGTPNDTQLWRTVTAHRDKGSPQWRPTINKGTSVQFASSNVDLNDASTWHQPRILYLQHASDPVVWFNYDLAFHKPDWLSEPRGTDVSRHMVWFPIVTFLQVGIDQFFGTTVPVGHGHNYADCMAAAWAAVTQPDGWSKQDTLRLQTIINQK
jgi:uncharacterized membrane protein